MHGNQHTGLQLRGKGAYVFGLQGKESADGHQHDVDSLESFLLFRSRRASNVAHVRDLVLAVVIDADRVAAPLCALCIIVPGVNFRDLEGILLRSRSLADLHALDRIVIEVVMAAKHLIRLKPQVSEAGNGPVRKGIQNDRVSLFLQCKTTVSMPGNLQFSHNPSL